MSVGPSTAARFSVSVSARCSLCCTCLISVCTANLPANPAISSTLESPLASGPGAKGLGLGGPSTMYEPERRSPASASHHVGWWPGNDPRQPSCCRPAAGRLDLTVCRSALGPGSCDPRAGESAGGSAESYYWIFGQYDGLVICRYDPQASPDGYAAGRHLLGVCSFGMLRRSPTAGGWRRRGWRSGRCSPTPPTWARTPSRSAAPGSSKEPSPRR